MSTLYHAIYSFLHQTPAATSQLSNTLIPLLPFPPPFPASLAGLTHSEKKKGKMPRCKADEEELVSQSSIKNNAVILDNDWDIDR